MNKVKNIFINLHANFKSTNFSSFFNLRNYACMASMVALLFLMASCATSTTGGGGTNDNTSTNNNTSTGGGGANNNNGCGSGGPPVAGQMEMMQMNASFERDAGNQSVANMTGVISDDIVDKVRALVALTGPKITQVRMRQVPGSSTSGFEYLNASLMLRQNSISMYIGDDGFIASGGTDFFLGSANRSAHVNAAIGVHSWAGCVNNMLLIGDQLIDQPNHRDHVAYLEFFSPTKSGINSSFYWYTLRAAAPMRLHCMTREEQVCFRFVNEGLTSAEQGMLTDGSCDTILAVGYDPTFRNCDPIIDAVNERRMSGM